MNSEAGGCKSKFWTLPTEEKYIKYAAEFATSSAEEIEKLNKKVEKMGKLELMWSSKVPEVKKTCFNSVSFKSSNKEEIKKEIKEYRDFYEKMAIVMRRLNSDIKMEEIDDSTTNINDLKVLLIDMDKVAVSGLLATNDSTVYRMHRQFIKKHTQIESMVDRIECIISRNKIKFLRNLLDECQNTILQLQEEMQKFQRFK